MNFFDLAWLLNNNELYGEERRRENMNIRGNAFELSDNNFRKLFRLNKVLADDLIEKISPFKQEPHYFSSIDNDTKILTALRFFGAGSYQLDVGSNVNINIRQPSVSRALHEVTDAFMASGLFEEKIHFPTNEFELNEVQEK